jgi:drug/metabolite transporter (DMT)-like permease
MPNTRTQLPAIPLAGPLIMLASALLFAVHNGFIKMLSPSYSAWDIAFYRFGCGLVVLIAIFGWRGNPFKGHNPGLLIIRGITGSIAFLSLVTAIRHIPLSTALVLFYAFPAFAAFFSQLLFEEKISRIEILFMLVALGGVMVILDYESGGAMFGQIMAVLASIFAGLTISIIRKLRASNGTVIIYLYFCILGTIITFPSYIADPRIPATTIEWVCVGGVVITSVVAQLLMTHGFQYCKSWEGGLYLMSEVIFTSLVGILFFIEILDWRFWAGGLLIFGSAVGLNQIRSRSGTSVAVPSR